MATMNHLAGETSPYLRQHAGNPVDWYPWGAEALKKARDEGKPIFLSAGYSACHWCHVMAHESFEHDDVAKLLNKYFVSIKIDREEFPDLDHFFMTATSLMTGRGGWPNSVWLMPDGRPWYAGTYFPREDQLERMGFKSMLKRLAEIWSSQRDNVEKQARRLMEAIRENNTPRPNAEAASRDAQAWSQHAHQHFLHQFDPRMGGFGDAPKFPPHSGLNMLIQSLAHQPSREIEQAITITLDAMARGGIHDHVGGGFHRYATDEQWHLPHFEKMLYDNALLLKSYARAAHRFDREDYRRVARGIAGWVAREMTHREGGFYAALDADSEGEEGLFYTWTYDELKERVPADQLESFCELFQLLPGGNYHDEATRRITGRNILHIRSSSTFDDARRFNTELTTLLEAREARIRPGLDSKIITSWNGMMISALAEAGRLIGETSFINAAIRARDFISKHLVSDNRLRRCWAERPSRHDGRLDDYAALALADVDLFEATRDAQHLDRAVRLLGAMLDAFYDPSTGTLFMTKPEDAIAGVRMMDIYDQGSPSGTGLAIQALVRAGHLAKKPELIETGRQIAHRCSHALHRAPSMTSSMLEGLLLNA